MKLKEIIEFLRERVPEEMALSFDNVGLMGDYDLNREIRSIKILMDLCPQNDCYGQDTLVVTHHPPLFEPESPTYTIHSNWDIIDGGANDALAERLGLEVVGRLDNDTGIGRICKTDFDFNELRKRVLENFEGARIANPKGVDPDRVGIISGFGLKNPDYIELAHEMNLDVLISGDLTQQTAILARNLDITLIDLGHHESEVPGLYRLAELLGELDVDIEVVDIKPIEKL